MERQISQIVWPSPWLHNNFPWRPSPLKSTWTSKFALVTRRSVDISIPDSIIWFNYSWLSDKEKIEILWLGRKLWHRKLWYFTFASVTVPRSNIQNMERSRPIVVDNFLGLQTDISLVTQKFFWRWRISELFFHWRSLVLLPRGSHSSRIDY